MFVYFCATVATCVLFLFVFGTLTKKFLSNRSAPPGAPTGEDLMFKLAS